MVRESFADVVREIVGDRRQRDVAEQGGGISHPYLNDWLQGRVPRLKTLAAFADGVQAVGWITTEQRRRLFRAAGYVDPDSPDGRELAKQPPWKGAARLAQEPRPPYGTSLADERETYRMLPPEEEESGLRIIVDGIAALNKELGRPIAISLDDEKLRDLTPEKARATLAFWRQQAEAGII